MRTTHCFVAIRNCMKNVLYLTPKVCMFSSARVIVCVYDSVTINLIHLQIRNLANNTTNKYHRKRRRKTIYQRNVCAK